MCLNSSGLNLVPVFYLFFSYISLSLSLSLSVSLARRCSLVTVYRSLLHTLESDQERMLVSKSTQQETLASKSAEARIQTPLASGQWFSSCFF